MNAFAVKFKSILELTSMKLKALAQYLNYDISYLSKWASGKSLPARSNIDRIATGVSEYLKQNCSDTEIRRLGAYLDADPADREAVCGSVREALTAAYFEADGSNAEPAAEGIVLFPNSLGRYSVHRLCRPGLGSRTLQTISASALFSMADKLSFYQSTKSFMQELERLAYDSRQGRLLLSTRNFADDVLGNFALLVSMVSATYGSRVEYHITGETIFTEITIIRNQIAMINTYLTTSRYLSCTQITDPKEVERLYVAYEKYAADHFKPLVYYNCDRVETYGSFYAHMQFYYIFNILTELFAPRELFEAYCGTEKAAMLSNEIQIALSFPTKILFSKEIFFQLLLTGKIFMMGQLVELEMEDRLRYLQNMVAVLRSRKNIQLYTFDRSTTRFQYDNLTESFSITESCALVRGVDAGGRAVQFSILDQDMSKLLMEEIESQCRQKRCNLVSDREAAAQILENVLEEFRQTYSKREEPETPSRAAEE